MLAGEGLSPARAARESRPSSPARVARHRRRRSATSSRRGPQGHLEPGRDRAGLVRCRQAGGDRQLPLGARPDLALDRAAQPPAAAPARRRPHRLRDRRGASAGAPCAARSTSASRSSGSARPAAVRDRPDERHRAVCPERPASPRRSARARARRQQSAVLGPRDLDRAEPRRCGVDHCTSSSASGAARLHPAQELDEPENARLRGAGARVELRLGREETTDRDAVEAAREPVVVPRLDGVRPAELVQRPCTAATHRRRSSRGSPGPRTAADHLRERRVDPDLVAPAARRSERDGRGRRAGRRRAARRPPADRDRRSRASGRGRAGTPASSVPGSRSAPTAQASCGSRPAAASRRQAWEGLGGGTSHVSTLAPGT